MSISVMVKEVWPMCISVLMKVHLGLNEGGVANVIVGLNGGVADVLVGLNGGVADVPVGLNEGGVASVSVAFLHVCPTE